MEKRIEELSLNAWPSLQTLSYDGWLLRFGGGYTRRSNSISPLYASEIDFEQKISNCEKLYGRRGQNTIFKIAEKVSPGGLDELLDKSGYVLEAPTSVQLLELKDYEGNVRDNLIIRNTLEEEWLANMQIISGTKSDDNINMERRILSNIITECCFAELQDQGQGQAVACGMGVIEDGFIGIYDIMVAKEARGKGLGRRIMEDLLSLGISKGVEHAYLQVMLDNSVALNLYKSLGFREIYKYWYRVSKTRA